MITKKQFKLSNENSKPILGDLSYDTSKTIKGNIIFIHGFKGFKDWGAHHLTANFFAEQGYRYIKFNLSHSGVSEDQPADITDLEAFGNNTVSKELADISLVIDHITNEFPDDKLFVIGHSRGGGLAILQARKDNRISNLVTWAAIADFSSLWKKEQEAEWQQNGCIYITNARTKQQMPLYKVLMDDFYAHKEEYDILSAAKDITIPWLILHGDKDSSVDFSVAQRLAQAQPNATIQKIENADHVFGASHPYAGTVLPAQLHEVCEQTLEFIEG